MRIPAVVLTSLLSSVSFVPFGYAASSFALSTPSAALPARQPAPATSKPAPTPREALVSWLKPRIPFGGALVDRVDAPVEVVHIARDGDTVESVANTYLDLTDVYLASELAKAI